ncbi:hypothetical protein [Kitasatospora sp. NPDC056731]|uniref:hypothetical protein n=1 Tax=Kitasatospora sp. NPDC056731 TaxID=3155422 RepID=UPI003417CC5E
MLKRIAVLSATAGLLLALTPGTAFAAVQGLPCGSGYSCDGADPGNMSFDQVDTDDHASDPGCTTVQLRSGKKDGLWYAWSRLTVSTGCGTYEGWIDRSYDGGVTWKLQGYYSTSSSNYGDMFFWPDNVCIRAGFKLYGEPWSKSGVTDWHPVNKCKN